MPVQKRSINLGSVLEALVPLPSETSPPPPPLGFSQGESVMKKRKMEKKGMMKLGNNKYCPQLSPPKPNPHLKKGKAKMAELSKRPQVTFLIKVSIEVA
jgi:hypothetical protein